MARIRTTKPEFWSSAQIIELSRDARLLFIGMWNFCDDNGRHKASLTLDTVGFELKEHQLPNLDYYNETQILSTYYDEVCKFIKEATGALKVYSTTSNAHS